MAHYPRRLVSSTVLLWLSALCAAGCKGGSHASPAHACEADSVRSCRTDDCRGEQTCQGSPRRWSDCECPNPADSKPDAGPPADDRAVLGTPCEGDDDCPDSAFCLTRQSGELFGGGAPNGVCAAPCESSPDCDAFAGAVCVPTSVVNAPADELDDADAGTPDAEPSLCLAACRVGERAECGGVERVACTPLGPETDAGYCRPVCSVDADCTPGTCQLATGTCAMDAGNPAQAGVDTGAECDPDASDQCAGQCLSLSDRFSLCAHRCVFGEPGDCAPAAARTPGGGCLLTTPGGGIGDLGYCGQLCDCTDDCAHLGAVCDAFGDDGLERVFGRRGTCTSPELVVTGSLSCE